MRRFDSVMMAAVVCLCSLAMPVIGQVTIYSNPITGTNPNTSNPYTTGQTTSSNLTGVGIGRGVGITGANANDRYNASSWNTTSIDTTAYFTISFTPGSGYAVDVSNLTYTSEASGSGPTTFAIRTSADNFTVNAGTPAESGANFSPSNFSNLTSTGDFRIYGWNASAVGGTYSVNSFTITGLVSNRWSGTTDGNLSNATNYVSGAVPTGNNGIQFEGSANTAVTVDAATTVQGIRFASGAAAFTVSGPNALTLGSTGNVVNYSSVNQTINSNVVLGANQIFDSRSGSLAFGGVISESGGARTLTIQGANNVTLSGANTYTGRTTISDGTLATTNLANGGTASGIGQSSNAASNLVFGAATATLRYTGSTDVTTNRGFTMSTGAGGGATIESSGTGTLSFDNTVAIAYGTTNQTRVLTLGGTNTGANTFGKLIANNGTAATSLTKAGAGTWVLSQANSYSGATTISGGTLVAANSTGSATGTSAITVSGTGVLSGGTGAGTTIGTVTGATNVQTGGTIRADSGSGTNTLTVGNVTIQNGGTLLANIAATNNNSTLALGGNVLNFVTGSRLGLVGQTGFTSVEGGPTLTYNLATLSSGSNIRLDGNVAGVADGFVFGEYVHGTGNVNSRPVFIDTSNFGLALNNGDRLVLNRTGNNLVLNFSPVPEPTTILGVAVGLVAVGGFIRKRLAKKAVVAA